MRPLKKAIRRDIIDETQPHERSLWLSLYGF